MLDCRFWHFSPVFASEELDAIFCARPTVGCIRNIAEVVSTVLRATLLIRPRLQPPTTVVAI